MAWCENEKVNRKMENIHSFQNILTMSGGVAYISGSQIPALDPYENLIYSQGLLVLCKAKVGYC
jgi:hypothetical protein